MRENTCEKILDGSKIRENRVAKVHSKFQIEWRHDPRAKVRYLGMFSLKLSPHPGYGSIE
jgi:hypothetical protein